MNAHTPGPWVYTHVPTSAGSAWRIGAPFLEKGCAWIYADGIRKGVDESLPRAIELAADARLIAAAPDLLAALRDLEMAANTVAGCYTRNPGNFASALQEIAECAEKARAAIAKATGETS